MKKKIGRVTATGLLCGLSFSARAGELDSIFRGAAVVAGGALLLLVASAGFVFALSRTPKPGSGPEVFLPVALGVLAFPLNVVWLFMSLGYATPGGYGWPLYALVASLPTAALATLLWRANQRRRAWAVVASLVPAALALASQVGPGWPPARTYSEYNTDLPANSADQLAQIANSPDATRVLEHADQMPTFPGGRDSVGAFVRRRLDYDKLARADQPNGRMRLRYVVGVNGHAYGTEVIQSLGSGGYDEAAARILQELTFTPARQNGEIVAVYDTVSVIFKRRPAPKGW